MATIGSWTMEADRARTARAYEQTTRGSPADCGCADCRNFEALDESAFPEPFRAWLASLGIDWRKAAEIYATPVSNGRLTYGGWFHAVGRLLAGPKVEDAPILQGTRTRDTTSLWHHVTETFQVFLDERRDLAFQEFGEAPLVKIEFMAALPWVLPEEPAVTQ